MRLVGGCWLEGGGWLEGGLAREGLLEGFKTLGGLTPRSTEVV